jgi:hypothetical protein
MVEYFPGAHPSGDPETLHGDEQYHRVLQEIKDLKSITPEEIHYYSRLLSYLDPENTAFVAEHYFEVGCRVFGHACPVFFMQSGGTETIEGRPEGRSVPRSVMLQVVRRDNQVCQSCNHYVPDNEIEFDHVIPFSKGGPTTVANLRLLCRTCNRKKSNSLSGLLRE